MLMIIIKSMIRFIRIYTPFIITLFTLANASLLLIGGNVSKIDYLFAIISGNSILLTIYMYSVSLRMCIWYKLNLLCLLLTQISSLLYNYLEINNSLYLWTIILFCSFGIICFLIFKKCYEVKIIKKKQYGKQNTIS